MDEAHRLMKKATGTIGTLMAELEKVERYLRTHKRMNDKVRAALDSVIENWEGSGKGIVESIEGLGKQLEQAEAERNELLMAVGSKHEGETRFETALRYIRERENQDSRVAASLRERIEK